MKTHRLLTGLSAFLMCIAITFGMSRGTFTYKSSNRQIEVVLESQDAETVSAVLSLLTLLIGCAQRRNEQPPL